MDSNIICYALLPCACAAALLFLGPSSKHTRLYIGSWAPVRAFALPIINDSFDWNFVPNKSIFYLRLVRNNKYNDLCVRPAPVPRTGVWRIWKSFHLCIAAAVASGWSRIHEKRTLWRQARVYTHSNFKLNWHTHTHTPNAMSSHRDKNFTIIYWIMKLQLTIRHAQFPFMI